MKNCDNCYWKDYKSIWCTYRNNKPKENVCQEHDYICCKCEGEKADYKKGDKQYCQDCLLKEYDIEEYTVTHYTLDGEYLGNDDDMSGVIDKLDCDIEFLEV